MCCIKPLPLRFCTTHIEKCFLLPVWMCINKCFWVFFLCEWRSSIFRYVLYAFLYVIYVQRINSSFVYWMLGVGIKEEGDWVWRLLLWLLLAVQSIQVLMRALQMLVKDMRKDFLATHTRAHTHTHWRCSRGPAGGPIPKRVCCLLHSSLCQCLLWQGTTHIASDECK